MARLSLDNEFLLFGLAEKLVGIGRDHVLRRVELMAYDRDDLGGRPRAVEQFLQGVQDYHHQWWWPSPPPSLQLENFVSSRSRPRA